jgi:S1-C subfamily serine protease
MGFPRHSGLSLLVSSLLGALLVMSNQVAAQSRSVDDLLSAVVRVKTYIEPDGRTQDTLGREREGSGVLIDSGGLVLTIGYLMVEARAAEISTSDGRTVPATVVGYDHETGFGLLRAILPLRQTPLAVGRSADVKQGDRVLVASFGGAGTASLCEVVATREFAGSWEYMLDTAIFTTPPHPAWSGAALITSAGKLVGIGSLALADVGDGRGPGNMFVPIDLLPPILGDLLAAGQTSAPARPWLGLIIDEVAGDLLVARVVPGGPGARAGIQPGAKIVGVGGARPKSLGQLYRYLWATGSAGWKSGHQAGWGT